MNTDFIYFNSRDELLRVNISQIVYFEADGNYTHFVLPNKLKGSIGINLAQTEKALSSRLGEKSRSFARIGKRYIINLKYIYQINVLKQRLVLSDGIHFAFQLEVSKEALKNLKDIYVSTKID